MPFARCPTCGSSFHLLVRTPIDEWMEEHVKERAPDGTPLLECLSCWVELRPGHIVKVREVPAPHALALQVGQSGVVEAAGDREAIVVRFGSQSLLLQRRQLSYVPGQPTPPQA